MIAICVVALLVASSCAVASVASVVPHSHHKQRATAGCGRDTQGCVQDQTFAERVVRDFLFAKMAGAGSLLSFDRTINGTSNKDVALGESILRRLFAPDVNYTSVLAIEANGTQFNDVQSFIGIEAMVRYFKERLWVRDWMQFVPVMMHYIPNATHPNQGLIHYSYLILVREQSDQPVSREHGYYEGWGLGIAEARDCIVTRLKFLRAPERTFLMTPLQGLKRDDARLRDMIF